jgi:hypothetical protein
VSHRSRRVTAARGSGTGPPHRPTAPTHRTDPFGPTLDAVTTAGYSGTPLPAKLGIQAGSRVLLDGAPGGFDLGLLPEGVTVHARPGSSPYDLAVVFCPDLARLVRRWPVAHRRVTAAGRVWVAWPKRTSGLASDLDENVVRDHGLAHGRVDVKVCAIDETWSSLAFVVRVRDR